MADKNAQAASIKAVKKALEDQGKQRDAAPSYAEVNAQDIIALVDSIKEPSLTVQDLRKGAAAALAGRTEPLIVWQYAHQVMQAVDEAEAAG